MSTPQILFLPHGGGPLPLLGDPAHREMVEHLARLSTELVRPSAILLISAHWEAPVATLTSAAQPPLIYDYSGFPAESYAITYPAPGHPPLAERLCDRLIQHGITARLDGERGFDHGLFVPLKLLYPAADIPCVQLSLLSSLDPAHHLQIGAALAELQEEKLLILGSGFSFHNMRAFFEQPTSPTTQRQNEAFEVWLKETLTDRNLTESARTQRLIHWSEAPSARFCHPREEHLLPLLICYGAAQRPCSQADALTVLGRKTSSYLWR